MKDKLRKIGARLFAFCLAARNMDDIRAGSAVRRLFTVDTVLMLVGIPVGIWIWDEPGRCFREGRLMTWVSTFQLFFIGYVAQQIWLIKRSSEKFDWRAPAAFWRIMAVGFVFLGFDEILKIHEEVDRTIHKIFSIQETDFTDMMDDVLIGIYGTIGLSVLVMYRREIKRFVAAWPYLLMGGLLTIATVVLDIVSSSKPISRALIGDHDAAALFATWAAVAEEVVKIYGEVFLLGAVLYCFVSLRDSAGGKTA